MSQIVMKFLISIAIFSLSFSTINVSKKYPSIKTQCQTLNLNSCKAGKTFTIDHTNNQFLKDGKPFRYVSGDLEYFKIPSVLWKDRLIKYKAAGLNAVQTYINWNLHEPEKGHYDFNGDLDFIQFFKLAQELDFVVILRPGPFVNAECDMGGLPYWLLSINKDMKLRTSDEQYMAEVNKWLSVIMPKIKPMLYQNGGPVVMVQVENEYAYYGCDHNYTNALRDSFRSYLGPDIILFTTDGISNFKCAMIDKVFVTIDFGAYTDAHVYFDKLREVQKTGPLVNSEFYSGWFNRWEMPYEHVEAQRYAEKLDVLLSMNASVNIYPFAGGTLFGFMSGAKGGGDQFYPVVTSYEFDGPLTEAGDPNDKYFAIRKVIGKHMPLPSLPLPTVAPKMELPAIHMKPIISIFNEHFSKDTISSENPQTFEELKLGHGFVLYSHNLTEVPASDTAVLHIDKISDRALVFVDKEYRGLLSATHNKFQLSLTELKEGSHLDILVENQGRYASRDMVRLKGITTKVILGNQTLKNWKHSLLFRNWDSSIQQLEKESTNLTVQSVKNRPTFFTGIFQLPQNSSLPLDSFLSFEGWGKGIAFLNGFNLGRYWPLAGPQHTLYSPAHLFKPYPHENRLTVFELEKNPCDNESECVLNFQKEHVLNGKVSQDNGF